MGENIPCGHIWDTTILKACFLLPLHISHVSHWQMTDNPDRHSNPHSATPFSGDLVPILCEGVCIQALWKTYRNWGSKLEWTTGHYYSLYITVLDCKDLSSNFWSTLIMFLSHSLYPSINLLWPHVCYPQFLEARARCRCDI